MRRGWHWPTSCSALRPPKVHRSKGQEPPPHLYPKDRRLGLNPAPARSSEDRLRQGLAVRRAWEGVTHPSVTQSSGQQGQQTWGCLGGAGTPFHCRAASVDAPSLSGSARPGHQEAPALPHLVARAVSGTGPNSWVMRRWRTELALPFSTLMRQ